MVHQSKCLGTPVVECFGYFIARINDKTALSTWHVFLNSEIILILKIQGGHRLIGKKELLIMRSCTAKHKSTQDYNIVKHHIFFTNVRGCCLSLLCICPISNSC